MFLKNVVYPILIYASSCSNGNQSDSSLQQVFGVDARKVLDKTVYDDLVGYIEGKETKCVGFVSGKDEVTTAAHCIDNEEYPTFRLKNGNKFRFDLIKKLDAPRDIVVLRTKDAFKTHLDFGSFEQKPIEILSFDFSKNLVTTSGGCLVNLQLLEYSAYTYECDTSHGNSGSPLIQSGKVVGIHIGYSKTLKANIGVVNGLKPSQQVALLGLDLERWPPRIKIPTIPLPDIPLPEIPLPNIPSIPDANLMNAISDLRNQSRVNYPCVTSALAAAGTGAACVACIVGTEGVGAGVCATMFCASFGMAIQSVKNNCR